MYRYMNTAIQVCQYDMKGKLLAIYKSAYDAGKTNGFSRMCILKCCEGKQKHHKNFTWRYNNRF
jgi:hypothetical protein